MSKNIDECYLSYLLIIFFSFLKRNDMVILFIYVNPLLRQYNKNLFDDFFLLIIINHFLTF